MSPVPGMRHVLLRGVRLRRIDELRGGARHRGRQAPRQASRQNARGALLGLGSRLGLRVRGRRSLGDDYTLHANGDSIRLGRSDEARASAPASTQPPATALKKEKVSLVIEWIDSIEFWKQRTCKVGRRFPSRLRTRSQRITCLE